MTMYVVRFVLGIYTEKVIEKSLFKAGSNLARKQPPRKSYRFPPSLPVLEESQSKKFNVQRLLVGH
jgi:hypothetical protein